MTTVLAIDDDRAVRMLLTRSLTTEGRIVVTAGSVSEGLEVIRAQGPDVVLLDVMLPDMSGLDAFSAIQQTDRQLPVIFITASGASDTAIQAMRLGAFDYLPKPLDLNRLKTLIDQALESRRLMTRPIGLSEGPVVRPDEKTDALVGQCSAMQEVFKAVGRVAPQDVTVLVRGESGTGKELVARAIFQYSDRCSGPFLAVNCAALTETLLESELFGHEKGAFTGAHARRIGKFEQSTGGTIFLDEIGDMTPLVQGKVLRLLQEQRFERVGGNETIETNVRIISATNRPLEEMVESGSFREDLFFRLNGYTINLPPLRERREDITLLLEHFLALLNRELGRDIKAIAPGALERLKAYSWPGNVRELQGVLRQAILQCSGTVLMEPSIPPLGGDHRPKRENGQALAHAPNAPHPTQAAAPQGSEDFRAFVEQRLADRTVSLYAESLERMERELLSIVLHRAAGNQSEAARILGITRGSLRTKIRTHGIVIGQVISVQ